MNESLDLLLEDGVIDEVLSRLKSGKEANVYLVRRGDEVLAAKVYKDREQRGFKNNSGYKEGRKVRNSRTQRAIDKGGRFGREAEEQAWKATEASALGTLHARGVRVPRPVLFYEGVLLMELVVDAQGDAAMRLIDVPLEGGAGKALYLELRRQIIGLLHSEIIHGDLSPYNILVAGDGPTIIDFPQIVSAAHNTRAEWFFLRDFQNVLNHFVAADPSLAVHAADGPAIWRAYVRRELTPDFVPPPPRVPQGRAQAGGRREGQGQAHPGGRREGRREGHGHPQAHPPRQAPPSRLPAPQVEHRAARPVAPPPHPPHPPTQCPVPVTPADDAAAPRQGRRRRRRRRGGGGGGRPVTP